MSVDKSLPTHHWECWFGIDWNTSVFISYGIDEDRSLTTDPLDTHIGAVVKATKKGWVQHLFSPILYWTEKETVVNSRYHNHDLIARSLQEAGISLKSADLDDNAGDIDELFSNRWIDGVYQRQGTEPYFNADVADRWNKKWWGWWGLAMQHLGIEVSHENITHFQDPNAAPELREQVVQYLKSAPNALAVQQPASKCMYCDELVNSHYQWDGLWMWNEVVVHHIEAHDFVVPNELVDRIRLLGSPLQLAPAGPDTPLPYPEPPD